MTKGPKLSLQEQQELYAHLKEMQVWLSRTNVEIANRYPQNARDIQRALRKMDKVRQTLSALEWDLENQAYEDHPDVPSDDIRFIVASDPRYPIPTVEA